MNIFDKAWAILLRFVPNLTIEKFDALTFAPNKSDAENKEIMMNELAKGKLGPILSIGAKWWQKHRPSSEESEKFIESQNLEALEQKIQEEESKATQDENLKTLEQRTQELQKKEEEEPNEQDTSREKQKLQDQEKA